MCLSLLLNKVLILSATKKATELSFYSIFKIYVLIVSTLAFVFKIITPIIFSAVKKVSFPQSRKFSTIKEIFQSIKFSTIKEIFHSQENFPQSRKFSKVKEIFHSQGNFQQSRDFSTVVKMFHSQGNFPQSRKFSTIKELFHSRVNFPQTKCFTQSKIFCKQRSKRFSKS